MIFLILIEISKNTQKSISPYNLWQNKVDDNHLIKYTTTRLTVPCANVCGYLKLMWNYLQQIEHILFDYNFKVYIYFIS